MQRTIKIIALSLLSFVGYSWAEEDKSIPAADSEVNWVESGEKFIYRLRWGIIEVGSATMEVNGPVDYHGQEAFEIKYTIRTNSWADKFYRIRDVMCSYVDPGMNRTLGFTQKKQEGKHRREVEVVVDWTQQLAKRTNFGKPDGEQSLTEDTFDQMSLVYALRNKSLQLGETFTIPTTNGKRLVETKVQVKKNKKIRVVAGKFDAVLLKPDTKDLKGVFRKSKGAGIDLWVTNDYRKIPLKMKSKVVVGSFTVELVRIEGPNQDVPAMLEGPKDKKKKPKPRKGRR